MTDFTRAHYDRSVFELRALAVEEFCDDAEMIEWALGYAAEMSRADRDSRDRYASSRALREIAASGKKSGGRVLEILASMNEILDGVSRPLLSYTRPELLAVIERREDEIAGARRHVSMLRTIADAMENDKDTLGRMVRRNVGIARAVEQAIINSTEGES